MDLLYRHATGGTLVSLLASAGLAYVTHRDFPHVTVAAWWLAMSAVLLFRAADAYRFRHSHPGRRRWRSDFFQFAAGTVLTALLWAAYTGLFMARLSIASRTTAMIVLCGMIGGGATVFAPSRLVSGIFCCVVGLPAALFFLLRPGPQNLFLGILGVAYLVVMIGSSHITHETVMRSIRFSRANEKLMREMQAERQKTEDANTELLHAQEELQDANRQLEFRIQLRTAELEREVQEKESYAQRLTVLASTDPLTGLLNRATLSAELATAVSRAQTNKGTLSVLFVDLDRFKEVNDALGHITGDFVLKTLAGRLRTQFPDLKVARWGGDEFVTFLGDIERPDQVLLLANALRECMAEPIIIDHHHVSVDATVGIAAFPQHARTQEELIWAADVAMFAGKHDKQSRIRVFDADLSQSLLEQRQLEEALREAITSHTLSLVFQPVIDVRFQRCDAMETLVRWRHPKLGVVSPSEFIPLAERTGDITDIGRWVLRTACREAANWPGHKAPAVAVNISTVQIEEGTIVHDVLQALDESKLPPERLHLELTESLFAAEQSPVVQVLAELRDNGIQVLLDDFGTGFSCLAYLRRLPVDRLKIDQSFVAGLHHDSGPIVESIVTTARAFDLELVAEGVETAAQAQTLTSMGVHFQQGHFFSGPLSAPATQEWLLRHAHTGGALRKAQTV